MELNACSNVNFDMQRFGIDVVASPKLTDCLLITCPVTANMEKALNDIHKDVFLNPNLSSWQVLVP
jgi:membrane-bound hydrogenase subunit mbhJ